MLTKIKVTNYLGNELLLDLSNPWETGVAVKEISGIGPQKATINTSDVSTKDGTIFNSARRSERNITLKLAYLWTLNEDISDVRRRIYTFFTVKKKVTLEFFSTGMYSERQCTITGYVEANENDMFKQETVADISIICPDPMFYDTSPSGTHTVVFGSNTPKFEFYADPDDLSNFEKATFPADEENTFEMSEIKNIRSGEAIYDGDDDVGLNIILSASGKVVNPKITFENTNETFALNTEMQADDSIYICTIRGKKRVRRIRGTTETNLINSIVKNSKWIQITKGTNYLTCQAEEGTDLLMATLTYETAFEGI